MNAKTTALRSTVLITAGHFSGHTGTVVRRSAKAATLDVVLEYTEDQRADLVDPTATTYHSIATVAWEDLAPAE